MSETSEQKAAAAAAAAEAKAAEEAEKAEKARRAKFVKARVLSDHPALGKCNTVVELDPADVKAWTQAGLIDTSPAAVKAAENWE